MARFRENNIQNLLNAMLYFKDKSISTNITKFLKSGCLDTQCQDKLHVTFQFLTNFNYFELCQQIDLLHHLILQLQYFWAYFYSSSFETTARISIFCCIWSEQKRSIASIIIVKNSWFVVTLKVEPAFAFQYFNLASVRALTQPSSVMHLKL